MRCLYPSARHDRFIHSIGIYHLAKQISDSLIEKFQDLLEDKFIFNSELFNKLRINFQLATLLHDVGHSPFSHTLEGYFKLKKINNEIKINWELKDAFPYCLDNRQTVVF